MVVLTWKELCQREDEMDEGLGARVCVLGPLAALAGSLRFELGDLVTSNEVISGSKETLPSASIALQVGVRQYTRLYRLTRHIYRRAIEVDTTPRGPVQKVHEMHGRLMPACNFQPQCSCPEWNTNHRLEVLGTKNY